MSVRIKYKKTAYSNSANTVLFSNEKFDIKLIRKFFSTTEYSYVRDLLKTSDLKKNIFTFKLSSKKKIALISIKNNLKSYEIENLGAEFYGRINQGRNVEYNILSDSINGNYKNFLGYF